MVIFVFVHAIHIHQFSQVEKIILRGVHMKQLHADMGLVVVNGKQYYSWLGTVHQRDVGTFQYLLGQRVNFDDPF